MHTASCEQHPQFVRLSQEHAKLKSEKELASKQLALVKAEHLSCAKRIEDSQVEHAQLKAVLDISLRHRKEVCCEDLCFGSSEMDA
jgi:hypothetical protein